MATQAPDDTPHTSESSQQHDTHSTAQRHTQHDTTHTAQHDDMVLRRIIIILIACIAAFQLPTTAQSDTDSDDVRYQMLFLEAMVQREKGNSDAAFHLLTRCRELRPDAPEVCFFLSQYYSAMRQPDDALSLIKKASDIDPANALYQETLAQYYIGRHDYKEAVEAYERLYEANKDRDDLLELIYRLYVTEKDYDQAIATLDRMEQIDGRSPKLSLAKSTLLAELGHTDQAANQLKMLADEYPNDLNYKALYADMLLRDQQDSIALDVLNNALNEDPQNIRVMLSLRGYHRNMRHDEQADSITRTIISSPTATDDDVVYLLRNVATEVEEDMADSTYVLSLFRLAMQRPDSNSDIDMLCAAYMDLKHMPADSIAPILENALQKEPGNTSARLQLIGYAWEEEDHQRVIELCEEARQYNPDNLSFYYYQGLTYYIAGMNDEALHTFIAGTLLIDDETRPEIAGDIYMIMGDILHRKGHHKEAFAAYDTCLEWQPDNVGCLNNYAYFLALRSQQLDKAERMSKKTIVTEPDNPTYLDTYAWVMFMQQHYAEAKIYIDQTLKNDSVPSADVLEHAGDIYAQQGLIDQAIDFWQQALKLEPTKKLLARKIKRKKYIRK